MRFQTPPRPPPAPHSPPSLFRAQARAADWQSSAFGNNNSGGTRGLGSRPRPPAGGAALVPSRVPTSVPAPGPPPAPTMYAFVRFLEDNVCYALPVSCVRDFSPRSRLDFDNQKVYAVYRGPEELGAGPESPPRAPRDWGALLLHKAQILALAGERMGWEGWWDRAGGGQDPGRGPGTGRWGGGGRREPLLAQASSSRPLGFSLGVLGVSERPDQLKIPDSPLCLPCLLTQRCQSVFVSLCVCLLFCFCSPGSLLYLSLPACLHFHFSVSHLTQFLLSLLLRSP